MPNPAALVAADPNLPNPSSLRVSASGDTVIDDVTGLEWERVPGAGNRNTFASGTAYCSILAKGGRKGWRLPTRIELLTLLDTSRANPFIDLTLFPSGNQSFMTSTPSARYTGVPAVYWRVDFREGKVIDDGWGVSVRCVR
jgi:hypothetical protein